MITLACLEPIPPGLDRKAFMALLQERLEGAAAGLDADARRQVGRRRLIGDGGYLIASFRTWTLTRSAGGKVFAPGARLGAMVVMPSAPATVSGVRLLR